MVKSDKPTKKELQILSDQNFLKLKESISRKIIAHLAQIERSLNEEIKNAEFQFPKNTFIQTGKISKGENYLGLPYFVLDYPRLFTQSQVFAFRTMLWWGNQFSCTLHIGGEQIKLINSEVLVKIHDDSELFFCVASNPWEYHYNESNYLKAINLTLNQLKEHIERNQFMKISRCIPVNNWNDYPSFTLESFARFLMLLK